MDDPCHYSVNDDAVLVGDEKKLYMPDSKDLGKKATSKPCDKDTIKWLVVISLLLALLVLHISLIAAVFAYFPSSCTGESVGNDEILKVSNQILSSVNSEPSTAAPSTAAPFCGNEIENNNIMVLQNLSQLITITDNNTELLEDSAESIEATLRKLNSIVGTLSTLEDIGVQTQGVVDSMTLLVKEILKLQNVSTEPLIDNHVSCHDLKKNQPDSPSGYYHINSQIVYCEMGTLCNSTEGGWTRLAYLDMSDATVDCPDGWLLYQTGGIRACGRPDTGGASCVSVKYPSNGISYSEVCGRVVGYQRGSPDAVRNNGNGLDSYYLDGVSITYGYPRQHIWSLMGGVFGSKYAGSNCPCNTPPGGAQNVKSFVGDDYFCESGATTSYTNIVYTNDPLWDGKGCGTQEGNCCAAPGLPWFHKTMNSTTDYLELRECGTEHINNEDVPVGFYEIYVR